MNTEKQNVDQNTESANNNSQNPPSANSQNLQKYANLLKKLSIECTTEAGSGHPTSSMSAAEIIACLTPHLKIDFKNPTNPGNDRIIFSKGHAAPLLYSWYYTQGVISKDELLSLRKFGSKIEGHPSMQFDQIDAATGSLGQGLGIGLGLTLGNRLWRSHARTFVILGDSEIAEGSVWEAAELANFHKAKNLFAIVDLNNLGQTRKTLYENNPEKVVKIFNSFGFETYICKNGNNVEYVQNLIDTALKSETELPKALIFQTKKGSGVSFLENVLGKHGKALTKEEAEKAYAELGDTDGMEIPRVGIAETVEWVKKETIEKFIKIDPKIVKQKIKEQEEEIQDLPIRQVYGKYLESAGHSNEKIIVLDAETSNSTFSEIFKNTFPERYFEMFIAEQNMISVAVGLSRLGFYPVVNTFGAFFTRAFDQIRMAAYSNSNILIAGSHVGVSIGEDGFSQMALEDIAMMRSVEGSKVYYPSDAVSACKITTELAQNLNGIVYLRNTRMNLPQVYSFEQNIRNGVDSKPFDFKNGFSVVRDGEKIAVIGAGVTLKEVLKARAEIEKIGLNPLIIDLFRIKPIDGDKLAVVLEGVEKIVIVEDHHREGGIFAAVCEVLSTKKFEIYSLAVNKRPMSGKPEELLEYEEIGAEAIVKLVKNIV